MRLKAKSGVALAPELIIITVATVACKKVKRLKEKVKVTQTHRSLLLSFVAMRMFVLELSLFVDGNLSEKNDVKRG